MFFTIFDLVLILILFLFIGFGFALGFIQAIGSLIGVAAGAWVAGMYYLPASEWLQGIFLGNENTAKVVAFILLFVIVNRLVGLIFWFINKIFKLITIIPFTKTIDRLLGVLLGFFEGALVLGLSLYFIIRTPFSDWFTGVIGSSKVALWMIEMGEFLAPLLPEALRLIQSVI